MTEDIFANRDDIAMLRVVAESGPISAADMVGNFIRQVKRGWIGGDGRLTDRGSLLLQAMSEVDAALAKDG